MKWCKKILRLLAIGLLGVFFVWFGVKYGRSPRIAYGEIFRELSGPLLLQYGHVPPGTAGTPWRSSRVNNNTMYYKVGKGEGSIGALFDSLEKALTTMEPPQGLRPVEIGDGAEKSDRASFSKALPIFRYEWGDWGAMGFVIGGASKGQKRQGAQSAKPQEENLGPMEPFSLGALIAFVAFLNRHEGATTYLTFLLDDAFDYRSLLSAGGRDAPGRDPPEIPRYPGLNRVYTFEERGEAFESILVVYNGRGNPHEIANFYRARMSGLGWELHELPDHQRTGRKLDEVLFFTRKGRECTIYTGYTGAPPHLQTIISFREAIGKG